MTLWNLENRYIALHYESQADESGVIVSEMAVTF